MESDLIKLKSNIFRRFLGKLGYKLPTESANLYQLQQFMNDWSLFTANYDPQFEEKVKQFKIGDKS